MVPKGVSSFRCWWCALCVAFRCATGQQRRDRYDDTTFAFTRCTIYIIRLCRCTESSLWLTLIEINARASTFDMIITNAIRRNRGVCDRLWLCAFDLCVIEFRMQQTPSNLLRITVLTQRHAGQPIANLKMPVGCLGCGLSRTSVHVGCASTEQSRQSCANICLATETKKICTRRVARLGRKRIIICNLSLELRILMGFAKNTHLHVANY